MLFHLIAIDETEFLVDYAKEECGKYFTIYLFNIEEVTYCCELEPSYWLEAVGFETEKELSESLYDDLSFSLHDSSRYVHARSIKQITSILFGDFDSLDDAREAYQANPMFLKF